MERIRELLCRERTSGRAAATQCLRIRELRGMGAEDFEGRARSDPGSF
jgi:hypothetical protein